MNKLGMHIHGMKPGIIEAVTLLQPRTVTIMNPKSEDIRAIRDVSPGTFIEMRKYEDGRAWRDTDPFDWAEMNYDLCNGLADGVIAWNEPFGHDDRGSCAPFDEWTYVLLQACRQLGTMEAVVLCMATGNWTGAADRWKVTDDFPLTCASAKYFGPHEYSWPTLQAGAGWYALRFKAWIEDLKAAGRDDFHFIISEAGLTQAIIAGRDDVGWRSGGPEMVTEDSYIATIGWYNAELCKVLECLGCCLYDYAGSHYGWATFEQLGLEHRIFQIQAPEPPEPPEPPNGGDSVIRVFDLDNIELFGDEALDRIAFHGITVHQPQNMRLGEWYWAVVKMREAMHAGFIYTGLKADGSPAVGQEAAWAWADDMGDADDILGNNYPTDWQLQADIGYLNDPDANMGPAYGQHGWFKLPYVAGPGRAWIRDPLRWSVLLTGMGMIDMTNHHTMFATWRLSQWEGEEPPVPPNGDLLAEVKKIGSDVAAIRRLLEGSPPEPPEPPEDTLFHGEFFNNVLLSGPPVWSHDVEDIDFDWGEGSPASEVNANDFSARWVAKRTFEAGMCGFHALTDDGFRLWVDEELLIDTWRDQPPTPYEAIKIMTAGQHDIKVEYYERGGGAVAKLWWE